MMYNFDVTILGGGPAGYTAAIRAAQNGMSVALVESRNVGGTCLNRGCIPTKALLHSGELLNTIKDAAKYGVNTTAPTYDLDKIYDRRDEVVLKLRTGVEKLLAARKVTLFNGVASLTGDTGVKVNDDQIVSKYLIVSTGSVPATLKIEGIEHCVNSDFLLEGKNEIPQEVVIVGGGVIGVEFAEFLLALNKTVTIVEYMDRILPTMDRDVSLQHAVALKKKGATIFLGAGVTKVDKTDDGNFNVFFADKKGDHSVNCGLVIVSTGRRANLNGLNAEGVGLNLNRGCICVDKQYRTNINNVFAIGDCIGGIQLAHFAAAQGEYVADLIADVKNPINLAVVPSCIYSSPEIASVGMTQAQAEEAGITVETGKFPIGANGKSIIAGAERGFVKTVFEKETGKLIGALLYCDRATDIIGELALAVANGLTRKEMERTIRPHPTIEESVGESVLASIGRAIHTL